MKIKKKYIILQIISVHGKKSFGDSFFHIHLNNTFQESRTATFLAEKKNERTNFGPIHFSNSSVRKKAPRHSELYITSFSLARYTPETQNSTRKQTSRVARFRVRRMCMAIHSRAYTRDHLYKTCLT